MVSVEFVRGERSGFVKKRQREDGREGTTMETRAVREEDPKET